VNVPEIRKFIRGVFSEPDGTPSFSRIASGFLVLCAIGWISYIVLTKFVVPEIGGLAALICGLYGANKIGNGIAALGKKDDDDDKKDS
jgi:hypothetical protein